MAIKFVARDNNNDNNNTTFYSLLKGDECY